MKHVETEEREIGESGNRGNGGTGNIGECQEKNEDSHSVSNVCFHLSAANPLPFQRGGAQGWGTKLLYARFTLTPTPPLKWEGSGCARKQVDDLRV